MVNGTPTGRLMSFCRKNKIFITLLSLQAIVTLLAFIGLFAEPITLTLDAKDIFQKQIIEDLSQAKENAIQTESRFQLSENAVVMTWDTNAKAELEQKLIIPLSQDLVRPGAYTLTIEYEAHQYLENSFNNDQDGTAYCTVLSPNSPMTVTMDTMSFYDDRTTMLNRFWVRPLSIPKDLRMEVVLNTGDLQIHSLCIQEQPVYRWIQLLEALLGTAVLVGGYMLVRARKRHKCTGFDKQLKTGFVLFGIILLSSMPLFTDFLYVGHDLLFHLERIASIAEELQAGQFPVRMQTGMLDGFGYATSLYYCDLFLYLPALLYNCMLPLRTCYQIYALLVNAATTLISYYCFSKMTKNKMFGLLGTAIYVLSTYRMANVHLRAAVGEYTAIAFIPLVALGLYQIYCSQKPRYREWLPLALGMAGSVQSHVITTEITAAFIGLIFIIYLRKSMRWARIAAFCKAGLLAAGLSLWYLVPLLTSMMSMDVHVNNVIPHIQEHGVYLFQLLEILLPGSGLSLITASTNNEMPLGVGLPLLLGLMLSLYCLIKSKEWKVEQRKEFRLMKICLILGVLAMLLSLRSTPWDSLKALLDERIAKLFLVIQFPWRYLAFATFLLAISTSIAMMLVYEFVRPQWKTISLLMVSAIVLTVGVFTLQFTNQVKGRSFNVINTWEEMDIGGAEYLLENAATPYETTVRTAGEGIRVISYEKKNSVARVVCENTGDEAGNVILPIYAYNGYAAYDESTGNRIEMNEYINRRLRLVLYPGYQGTVLVKYEAPTLWRISEAVSLLSYLWLAIFAWVKRRKRRAALSSVENRMNP
ncbi:MAG: hypothetical protein PHI98_00430 [Eubacteriales bacterium]|nr:hypothetical protein [Eubacteriales bacterium]